MMSPFETAVSTYARGDYATALQLFRQLRRIAQAKLLVQKWKPG